MFVTAYALMLFSWWETKHEPARLALFAVLGLLSFAILLTFSRNAFLGFFLVNGLFVVWKFNMKKLGLALLGTGIAVALAPERGLPAPDPRLRLRARMRCPPAASRASGCRSLPGDAGRARSGAAALTRSCGRDADA